MGELAQAGVTSLKIEGRLKDAAYVRNVVDTYRRALDGTPDAVSEQRSRTVVYSRESSDGFFGGPPNRWRTEETVGDFGVEVGRVTGPPDRRGRIAVRLDASVEAGDGLAWRVGRGRRGARVTWASTQRLRLRGEQVPAPNTKLYLTGSASAGDPLEGYDLSVEREWAQLTFFGRAGEPLGCKASRRVGHRTFFTELLLEPARGGGLEELLPERFSALASDFEVDFDLAGLGEGLFVPASALKSIRREVRAFLESASGIETEAEIDTVAESVAVSPEVAPAGRSAQKQRVAVRLWQAEAVELMSGLRPSGGWILPLDADAGDLEGKIARFVPPAKGVDEAVGLVEKLRPLPEGTEVLCPSWEAFRVHRSVPELSVRLDWGFNVANQRARDLLREMGFATTSSVELEQPLEDTTAVVRLNPLVSITRFPPSREEVGRVVENSHGDAFCLEPLGRGLWGLFLLDRLPAELPEAASIQVDVYLPREPQRRERTLEALGHCLRASCPDDPAQSA